jgi:hypothetical protein
MKNEPFSFIITQEKSVIVMDKKAITKALNAIHANPKSIFRTLSELNETQLQTALSDANPNAHKENAFIFAMVKGNKIGLFQESIRTAKTIPTTVKGCLSEAKRTISYALKYAKTQNFPSVTEEIFRNAVSLKIEESLTKKAV